MGEPDLDALLRDLDDAEQQDLACCIQLCRDAAAAIRRLREQGDTIREQQRAWDMAYVRKHPLHWWHGDQNALASHIEAQMLRPDDWPRAS